MFYSRKILSFIIFISGTSLNAYDYSPITTCAGPYACIVSSYLGLQFPDGSHQTTAGGSGGAYTPALAANWSTVPTTIQQALDSLVILQHSAVGAQPSCTSANRGLPWLVEGAAGVADIYQICSQTISGFSWITH